MDGTQHYLFCDWQKQDLVWGWERRCWGHKGGAGVTEASSRRPSARCLLLWCGKKSLKAVKRLPPAGCAALSTQGGAELSSQLHPGHLQRLPSSSSSPLLLRTSPIRRTAGSGSVLSRLLAWISARGTCGSLVCQPPGCWHGGKMALEICCLIHEEGKK